MASTSRMWARPLPPPPLVSLGYSQSEAALAVSKIDASLPVEEIIKLALRGMAGRR